ncbi:MAG: hypothetical protein M0R47_05935 [Methylobacter sp.]|uniref:hypothetical protein n=1 Tax=Methylobacter sp. TaxID=2051955 RepID=UPI0025F0EB2F|nr:hypothetical protein [Methylobacter sp.]MCK9620061.1 hypothetical protein [Methylobacter sp.]
MKQFEQLADKFLTGVHALPQAPAFGACAGRQSLHSRLLAACSSYFAHGSKPECERDEIQ